MPRAVRILATADIHSPRYLGLFRELIGSRSWSGVDVVVLAGDTVERNNISAFEPVYSTIRSAVGKPIIAVFGNEEYHGYEDEYRRRYKEVTWLCDEYIRISLGDATLCIIGTRGALDKPTPWQDRNMPWLRRYYQELPSKISRLAEEARSLCDYVILVSHYGVTYRDLRGEKPSIWPYLASRSMEKIIRKKLFDAVIHGHAHKSLIERVDINGVPVHNVSLPAFRKLFVITIGGKKGLLAWLEQ